jgi:hypothetical protein
MILFDNINYLKTGNPRQQKAYELLEREGILLKLKTYTPLLVGTIPIGIDIETSDLDIVCCWENKKTFINDVRSLFGNETNFQITESIIRERDTVISNFHIDDFEIEIFGQNVPSKRQFAYRHMIIEYRLLQEKGETFRQQIIDLKRQGMKTEPAFCHLLGLSEDSYTALLKFEE